MLNLFLAFMLFPEATGQTTLPLYPGPIPNSIDGPDKEYRDTTETGILIVHKISRPTLTVFLPKTSNALSPAIIICPGGGYQINAYGHEGLEVGRKCSEMGIAAFVLKYRIPDDHTMPVKENGPLQDLQRAMQLVREGAAQWSINPQQIGVMGFSAGGHLAASLGVHYTDVRIANPLNTPLRPDFLVLVYPVISFTDSIGHPGSRENLIGKNPDSEKIRYFSNELQVNADTPPAFLVHAKDDWVKVQNSLAFAQALETHKIPHHLVLFETGGHGYGMINPQSAVRWMDELGKWMRTLKLKAN